MKIRLFCTAGVSTSLLMAKMREAADSRGLDVLIDAKPVTEIQDNLNDVDVALLAPQAGYLKGRTAKVAKAHNVPLEVISMQDYGTCNGEKVLDQALRLAD